MELGSRLLTVERIEALARLAVQNGSMPDTFRDSGTIRRLIRWDVSGGCTDARFTELHARWSATHGKAVTPMTVILETRCRRCGWCLGQRRNLWAFRAMNEWNSGVRNWFVTLTATPEVHYEWLCHARSIARERGTDFEELSEAEKFTLRVQCAGQELTRFIKRVRKNSKSRLRYLLVAEAHESGLPHFHMLIHEQDEAAPVRKRVIKDAWLVGFSKVVLSPDSRGAWYLCKYLGKDARTRVRASFRYGGCTSSHKNPSGSVDMLDEHNRVRF